MFDQKFEVMGIPVTVTFALNGFSYILNILRGPRFSTPVETLDELKIHVSAVSRSIQMFRKCRYFEKQSNIYSLTGRLEIYIATLLFSIICD